MRLDVDDTLFLLFLAALGISGAVTGWLVGAVRDAWQRLGVLDALTPATCAEAAQRAGASLPLEVGGRVVPLNTFDAPMSGQRAVHAQVRRFHEHEGPHAGSTTVDPNLIGWGRTYPGFDVLLSDYIDNRPREEEVLAEVYLGEPFMLEDSTGQLLVDTAAVPCALRPTAQDGRRTELTLLERPALRKVSGVLERRRGYSYWEERALAPGDLVYVHGTVEQATAATRPAQHEAPAATLQPRLLSSVSKQQLLNRQTWRLVLSMVGVLCGLLPAVAVWLSHSQELRTSASGIWLWGWLAAAVLNGVAQWMLLSTRRTVFHRLRSRRGLLISAALLLGCAYYVAWFSGAWAVVLALAAG